MYNFRGIAKRPIPLYMLAHAYVGINIVFLWEFSSNWRFSENPKYKLTLLIYMSFVLCHKQYNFVNTDCKYKNNS